MIKAFPSYETAAFAGKLGLTGTADSARTQRSLNASSDFRWLVSLNPLPLQPGAYTITNLNAMVRFCSSTNVDQLLFVIYRFDSGSSQYKLLRFVPLTQPGSDSPTLVDSGAITFELTVPSGVDYRWGIAVRGLDIRTSQPVIWHQDGTSGPNQTAIWAGAEAPAGPVAAPLFV